MENMKKHNVLQRNITNISSSNTNTEVNSLNFEFPISLIPSQIARSRRNATRRYVATVVISKKRFNQLKDPSVKEKYAGVIERARERVKRERTQENVALKKVRLT